MTKCSACGSHLGCDAMIGEPHESGGGHIEAVFNPEDEADFVEEDRWYYCSIECLSAEKEELPESLSSEMEADDD